MLLKSVQKAKDRLRLAAKQLDQVACAENYQDFAGHWYLFLVSSKNIYTMLEQGAKDNPQCRQWFGGIKQTRKSDPLLQYLFQARNDDEHGLNDVTRLVPGHTAIGKAKPGYSKKISMSISTDEKGKLTINSLKSHDGLPVLIEQSSPHAVLMPVSGLGGIIYNPPIEHLGAPLPDDSPLTVGRLGLSYLEALVAEAERRLS